MRIRNQSHESEAKSKAGEDLSNEVHSWGVDPKCLPKAYVLKPWHSDVCFWELVVSLTWGVGGGMSSVHWGVPLKVTLGPQPHPYSFGSLVSNISGFALCITYHDKNTSPEAQSSNQTNSEPPEVKLPLYKLTLSDILLE